MIDELLHRCLFFTSARLYRVLARMAEEEFSRIGLSPTYAFLLLVLRERPGCLQKDLCETLLKTPSTLSRFVDTLVSKGLVTRSAEGKGAQLFLTERGTAMMSEVESCWSALYRRVAHALGEDEGRRLNAEVDAAAAALERHFGPFDPKEEHS